MVQEGLKQPYKRRDSLYLEEGIGRIMADEGLVSVYTQAHLKVMKAEVNESEVGNELDRNFNGS